MQPLDLIFIKMLALFAVYEMIKMYFRYFKTNKKTSDKILETYVQIELEKRLRRKR